MPDPQNHDCAVAFCVDGKYFPFALFMIWQIAHLNPYRRFDFVISAQEELVLPDWAKPYGIVMHRPGELPAEAEVARFSGSMSTVLRIMLADELGDRYRRIIYMDSDIFVEGGDLGRLMDIDLGPHALGAVLDCAFFYKSAHHAYEYQATGLPARPYFNSGFMVIDTRAFREQEIARRSFDVCKTYPVPVTAGDQTLLNMVLLGEFAQLAPCWNWHLTVRNPFLAHHYPVFHHHFVSSIKPNLITKCLLPVRFNLAYRDFMRLYYPEGLAALAPEPGLWSFRSKEQALILLDHVQTGRFARAIIRQFPDPYVARL